jgi:hypothetical protein
MRNSPFPERAVADRARRDITRKARRSGGMATLPPSLIAGVDFDPGEKRLLNVSSID